jgi:eukaryotic-like serine/threonine-protein kinase
VTDTPSSPDPRYRMENRIATGGMGEVWRATDTILGREVAVKVLKPEYADDAMFRSRFEAEARHAASLHHPNIASVFDAGELPADDGSGVPRPYLVMELVPGKPLSALLRQGEPMPAETATDLLAQAADGVAAAHALGIVHRDIKPGNLLVTPSGQVKITDFGIARAADASGITQTGQVIGTPGYISPEQAEGKQATMASDVYSLGVVLYECLAGRRPFVADTPIGTALAHLREQPPPLPDSVPKHLRDAVTVALAKEPARRFDSAATFGDVLRGAPVPAALLAGAAGAAAPGDDDAAAETLVAGAAAGAVPAGAAAAAAAGTDETRTMPRTTAPPPGDEPSRRRGAPAWLPWVLAAAAVLAVVLLLTWLVGDDEEPASQDDPAPSSQAPSQESTPEPTDEPTTEPPDEPTEEPTTEPSPTEDTSVEVVAEDYIGMDAKDAAKELRELGLKPTEERVENDGTQEEGTVSDVEPTGTLQEGDAVTLYVWDKVVDVPEEEPTDEQGGGNSGPGGEGGGPGDGNGRGNDNSSSNGEGDE